MVVAGACCVVLGGLVAAITEPLDLAHGSWLAAYLVLVCGVAQYAMGRVLEWQDSETVRSSNWPRVQFGAWNLGNAGVIAGALATEPLLVDSGSVLLVLALVIALRASLSDDSESSEAASKLMIWAYRILLLILIVSIPVGILLSHLRNS
jgi:hypothetical protein